MKYLLSVIPWSWFAGYTNSADFRVALERSDENLSRGALLKYLRAHLSVGSDADRWLESCCAAKMPPLAAEEIAQHLGISASAAYDMLFQVGVPYVRLSSHHGDRPRFSPLLCAEMISHGPCQSSDVARLFDVNCKAVREWRRTGLLACSLGHRHARNSYMSPVCWLAYLTQNVSSEDAPPLMQLWQERLIGGDETPLFGATQVAQRFGSHHNVIRKHAIAGKIRGILTPGGKWRFPPQWLP